MTPIKNIDIAKQFGSLLDQDSFVDFIQLLDINCQYLINDDTIIGRDKIAKMYEDNMKEGREKFDELIWGESTVKEIESDVFDVFFSDYLKLHGKSHRYHCRQRIKINEVQKISQISHHELEGEREKLKEFYIEVGLA